MASNSDSGINPVFADLSVLIEYCTIYFDEYHYANEVLNKYCEEGGKIVVSANAWQPFNERMTNKERLWDHLLTKTTEHMKSKKLGAADFKADVLNDTSLEQDLGFELSQEHLPEIVSLREIFEDEGFDSFRDLLDDARIQGNIQRREIEQSMAVTEYTRGESRGSWVSKTEIGQYTSSEAQTESLMDFGYWRRENDGAILIGSMSKASSHIRELTEAVESVANYDVNVLSPQDVFENSPVFS